MCTGRRAGGLSQPKPGSWPVIRRLRWPLSVGQRCARLSPRGALGAAVYGPAVSVIQAGALDSPSFWAVSGGPAVGASVNTAEDGCTQWSRRRRAMGPRRQLMTSPSPLTPMRIATPADSVVQGAGAELHRNAIYELAVIDISVAGIVRVCCGLCSDCSCHLVLSCGTNDSHSACS